MNGQYDVATPDQYIDALEEPRRSEIVRIDAFIRDSVPDLAPHILYKILAYGPIKYRDAKGKESDGALVCLSSNKQYISLYLDASIGGESIAERRAAELPKAKVGKCCIRFKRFDDLDHAALRSILQEAAGMENSSPP